MSQGRSTTPIPTRKQKLPDLNKKIKLLLTRMVAARCYELIGGSDINEAKQLSEIQKAFHGSENYGSQLALMLTGLKVYEPVMEKRDVYNTGASDDTNVPFAVARPFILGHTDWVVNENLTKEKLSLTYIQNKQKPTSKPNVLLSGRTLATYAKAERAGAKKITSLMLEAVKEKILQKEANGEYGYASGKNREDLCHFLRLRMENWQAYNGPSGDDDGDADGSNNTDNVDEEPPTPDAANVLIDAVAELDWDTTNKKAASELIFEACTSKCVKVSFKGEAKSVKTDIFKFICTEDNPTATDVLSDFVRKNELVSDDYDETALAAASAYFSAEKGATPLDETKLPSYADDYYPVGWGLFWLQGPLSPRKYRLDILQVSDVRTSSDQEKDKDCGRKKHRESEKKLKDAERSTGAANGSGRGVTYRDKKDRALIAQQQEKQDQHAFMSALAKITTILKSLESSRDNKMMMASEWRLGGNMDKWSEYMLQAESLEIAIAAKREEFNKLHQKSSVTTSHVDSFLSVETKPTSAKKRKAVESSGNDSDSE